jgi:hypothetical protein
VLLLAGGAAADASWTATVNGTEVTVTYEGSGTAVDPYKVDTLNELQAIGKNATTTSFSYELTSDIDATPTTSFNSGSGFSPINQFSGNFSGGNQTISGLFMNRPNASHVGLFGNVTGSGFIKELTLTNANVTGNVSDVNSQSVGGLVGNVELPSNHLVQISDIVVNGSIEGTGDNFFGIGGIVGSHKFSDSSGELQIKRAKFSGTITADKSSGIIEYAGGIVGTAEQDTTISNSTFVGPGFNFTTTGSGLTDEVGLAIGFQGNGDAIVRNFFANIDFLTNDDDGPIIGDKELNNDVTDAFIIFNDSNQDSNVDSTNIQSSSVYQLETNAFTVQQYNPALTVSDASGASAADQMSDLDFGSAWALTDGFPVLAHEVEQPFPVIDGTVQGVTQDAGTTVVIDAPVENLGATDTVSVTLEHTNGTVIDTNSTQLAFGQKAVLALTLETNFEDHGVTTYTVATQKASESVTVTLNRVNIPPVATNTTVALTQDTTTTGNITDDVTDADGDTLLVNTTPVRGPLSNATLEITSSGAWSYTPPTGYTGNDSFAYNVSDQNGSFTIGEVAFTITAPAPSGGSGGGGGSTGGAAAVTTGGSAGADGTDSAGAEAGISTVTTIAGTAPEVRLGSGTDPTGTPLVSVGFRSETPLTTRLGVGSLRSMTQLPDDGAFVAAADIRFPADTDTDAIDEVRMTLHTASVAARGHDVDALAIYHLDAETDTWTRLETVRATDGAHTVLTAQPVGFSVYGVFAVDAPAVPATPAPTPTAGPGTPTPTPVPAAEDVQPADPALLVGAVGVAVLILLAVLFGRRE